jgi:N-acetylmuramoyl-L-alanine amidase
VGRIFVCATYGGTESNTVESESVGKSPTEAQEMMSLRDRVVPELRSRGLETIAVPDTDNLRQAIDWINQRARLGDIALGIHADAYAQSQTRGVSAFYIAKNSERKNHAHLMLLAFCSRMGDLPNRGSKPDTATGTGSLAFCRRLIIPSLLMEIGYKIEPEDVTDNAPTDRHLIQAYRRDMALAIADGLVPWSRDVQVQATSSNRVSPVTLKVNDEPYPEKGLAIDGNIHIPIDLADQLGVNMSISPYIRRIRHRGVVYIKAIELRDLNISLSTEIGKVYNIRSQHAFASEDFDRITAPGHTTTQALHEFLAANNAEALNNFPDLADIYIEEAQAEGINHDLAFAQMCLETRFLHFSSVIAPTSHNFASLGNLHHEWATFPDVRTGVRAHIQQLKAYATVDPLVQECVAPRFEVVKRGIAPTIRQLNGRWSADSTYGTKLAAVMRQLYETAGLL